METILWSDGHTSLISEEEAFQESYVEPKEDDYIEVLNHNDLEFEWNNDRWVQR